MSQAVIVSLLLLSLLLAGRPASAGWVIDETLSAADGANRQPTRHQVMLQSNRMKRVTLNQDGSPSQSFILDLDAETVAQVDYQRQQYVATTLQEFVQVTTGAMSAAQGAQAEAMAKMQEAMKNMPPERRKIMEEMMKSRMPQLGGASGQECREPSVEFRKTGQESTIAGYRAAQYEILADGKLESEMWLAREITAWRELDPQKLQRFAGDISKLARCAPGQARAGLLNTDQAMKLAVEGYPVRTVIRGGAPVTSEVVKAISQPVPDPEFQPPTGFTRKTFREMMSR